jgi:hypothetical protein
MMDYLQKRHPLYFLNKKISKTQIRDLVRRLKYRLQSKSSAKENPTTQPKPKEKEKELEVKKPSPKVSFQSAPIEVGKPVPLASVNNSSALPKTFKTGA